ncbi:hypothetical protein KSS87_006950 [Heliosperma pusillum]|nr:hypothetical protein KSS87_006950 [Heliosperma pusillum]
MFGSTVMQFQEKKFDIGFGRLGEMNRDAQHYVTEVGMEKWSICHDGGHRYDILTTNLVEAYNNVLKGAYFLPITSLVHCIFFRLNAYFVERREETRKRLLRGLHYSSKITHLLEESFKKGAYHKVVSFDHVGGLYQVTTRRGSRKAYGFADVHRTCNSKIQVMPQEKKAKEGNNGNKGKMVQQGKSQWRMTMRPCKSSDDAQDASILQ